MSTTSSEGIGDATSTTSSDDDDVTISPVTIDTGNETDIDANLTTNDYTFVSVIVQLGNREQIEFRREYDPAHDSDPLEIIDKLVDALKRYLEFD